MDDDPPGSIGAALIAPRPQRPAHLVRPLANMGYMKWIGMTIRSSPVSCASVALKC